MSKSEEAYKGQPRDWNEDSDSQKKNEYRLELCDKNGVYSITVPYAVKKNIEEYVSLRSNWID